MPWIISNGKSYVEITPQNQMITTCYIDQAHAFTNKKTAEKYCSLLPISISRTSVNSFKPFILSGMSWPML